MQRYYHWNLVLVQLLCTCYGEAHEVLDMDQVGSLLLQYHRKRPFKALVRKG